jgi:hypothetical protein
MFIRIIIFGSNSGAPMGVPVVVLKGMMELPHRPENTISMDSPSSYST